MAVRNHTHGTDRRLFAFVHARAAISASNDRELRGSMISSCCESEESERDIACLGDGGLAGNPFLTLTRNVAEKHIS